jgi:hypothetical protein
MKSERRKNFRIQWQSLAMISASDGDWSSPCVLSDFSNGGAKISGLDVRHIPDHFVLRMARGVRPRDCRVLWRRAHALGVEFTDSGLGAEKLVTRTRMPRRRSARPRVKKLERAE